MNSYCTFYLVRHGETDMNVAGLLQGHTNSILTEKGKEQAQALAKNLHAITFDAIFSSDLVRAKNTAEILALERKLAVQTTTLIRERNWGKIEGQVKKDVLGTFNDLYARLSDSEKFTYKSAEDIETDEEIISRFIRFIRETAVLYPKKNVLVVTHGGALTAFLIHLGFWTYKEYHPIPNAAYIKLSSDGIEFFVEETHGLNTSTPRELIHSDR